MPSASTNSTRPALSIVIATMNASATLAHALDSVLGQTAGRAEIVVVDGGSTDGTVELLKTYGDAIAHWRSETDNGIYDAWNKALAHAHGAWIYFMGADDTFADARVLERLVPALDDADKRGVRVVYGQVELVGADGRRIMLVGRPWGDTALEFRHRKMAIPHQGCFTHRDVFAEHGAFDASYRIAGDYELLLRELKDRDALFVPLLVARMGNGGVSNSLAGAYGAFAEQIRARRTHGLERMRLRTIAKKLIWRGVVGAAPIVGEQRVRRVFDLYLRAVGKPQRYAV